MTSHPLARKFQSLRAGNLPPPPPPPPLLHPLLLKKVPTRLALIPTRSTSCITTQSQSFSSPSPPPPPRLRPQRPCCPTPLPSATKSSNPTASFQSNPTTPVRSRPPKSSALLPLCRTHHRRCRHPLRHICRRWLRCPYIPSRPKEQQSLPTGKWHSSHWHSPLRDFAYIIRRGSTTLFSPVNWQLTPR